MLIVSDLLIGTLRVVIVFAMSSTLSTLMPITFPFKTPFKFLVNLQRNEAYADMGFNVSAREMETGLISSFDFDILNAYSIRPIRDGKNSGVNWNTSRHGVAGYWSQCRRKTRAGHDLW